MTALHAHRIPIADRTLPAWVRSRNGRRTGPGALACLAALALLLGMAGCGASSPAPPDASALYYFKQGNEALKRDDYRSAIAGYERAIAEDPAQPDIFYNLGLAYYRAQRYRMAVDAWSEAVRLHPAFPEAHFNLALAYDKLYNLDAADHHYNRYRALIDGEAGTVSTAAAQPARAGRPTGPQSRAPPPTGGLTGQPRVKREAPAPPNPQQGSEKWWTQDRFLPNR